MIKRLIQLLRWAAIAVGALGLVYVVSVIVLTMREHQSSGATEVPAPPRLERTSSGPTDVAHVDCRAARVLAGAAAANAQDMATLAVAPFGVAETGWQFYEPLIAREIGTDCAGTTAGFAGRLRAWQAGHGVTATGHVDALTLNAMAAGWLRQRPFVAAMRHGCPPSPDPSQLAAASTSEAYGGKTILARPAVLVAYRRMVAAARHDGVASSPLLAIASAWRGPDEEIARCAELGCGTAAQARCSAHRTGLALDFVLRTAPGNEAFSTAAANRLALSQTPTYRWLVNQAGRFGFVNYPYEPWHWEWTGERP